MNTKPSFDEESFFQELYKVCEKYDVSLVEDEDNDGGVLFYTNLQSVIIGDDRHYTLTE